MCVCCAATSFQTTTQLATKQKKQQTHSGSIKLHKRRGAPLAMGPLWVRLLLSLCFANVWATRKLPPSSSSSSKPFSFQATHTAS
jgi:hypothetical protein